jgi:hypothetical protein
MNEMIVVVFHKWATLMAIEIIQITNAAIAITVILLHLNNYFTHSRYFLHY